MACAPSEKSYKPKAVLADFSLDQTGIENKYIETNKWTISN